METIYKGKRLEKAEILKEGQYQGYQYTIITMGTHPCSYIKLPEGHKYNGKHYDEIPLECHCGLTYSKDKLMGGNKEGEWYIGWDYAHLGDHLSYNNGPSAITGGHRWTLEELENEMFETIEHLKTL